MSLILFLTLLCSCSETKNLAEGEKLYVGIKEIAYDRPPKKQTATNDSTGVITALGNAYNTVEAYLTGGKEQEGKTTNAPQESLPPTHNEKRDLEAYATAKDEVEAVLAYSPNNSLMGSSYHRQPLAIGLWTYNKYVYSKRRFGKWMFNTFAASPVYVTTVNPRVRAQVARNTLRNYGYFRSQTSFDTIPQRNPKKAKISYQVHPGPLFHVDSIAYLAFPEQADSMIRANMRRTLLHKGDPFSVPNLDEERNRLSKIFRNNGYYYFRPDYIHYRADTVARPLHVQLQVTPSANMPEQARQQYYMGNTRINVYQYGDRELVDTLKRPLKMSRSMRKAIERERKRREARAEALARQGKVDSQQPRRRSTVTMAYSGQKGRPPLKMRAIRRFISYRQGDLYSQDVQDAMQNNLAAMGIFSQVNVKYSEKKEGKSEKGEESDSLNTALENNAASSHPSSLTSHPQDTLDVEITLRLDRPYDAEFKGNIATKSNGLVGPGVSFSMSKQNVFRGAETLGFEAYGSYEWMTGAQMKGKSSLLNSFEYGASLNLTYPRLLLLGLGQRFNRRAKATTAYKLNADFLNRSGYFSRVSFGARVSHTYQRNPRIRHEITPLRLEYEKQLHTTAKFDSIIQYNQALYASLRDQFVPSAQYTVSFTNKRKVRYDRHFTFTVKEAGNLTSLGYRMAGKPFNQLDKGLFGVPFAQYIKVTGEFTESFRLFHTKTHIVAHIFAGVVHSYGNSTIAPYGDLFTVGGANSIRAFGVRSIGPGSYHPRNSGYSYIDQMGDLRLEANLEYRFPLVSNLYGAIFVDAGNVWLLKPDENRPGGNIDLSRIGREIALGTGFGLRYDLQFLVIRFDVGIGIHAPYDTGRSGYYNMTKFWDSLGFHLAVGYPF
ncbi:MAG: BamA/TamA family outer membrane protein [Bacteroidaceae bacterium]|nr:BamA/TamA family outer membrane protein [Bacteroidaceae bacterium]